MDNKLQIITFIFSFIYGFSFFYLEELNYLINKKNKCFIKYLNNTLFILNMVLIYVIINYKINNGYFHIYFLITIVLGYFLANYTQNNVKDLINKYKKKNKWYNCLKNGWLYER